MGATCTRHSLRPLDFEGATICKTRTLRAARILNYVLSAVIARLDRAIQYAAAYRLYH